MYKFTPSIKRLKQDEPTVLTEQERLQLSAALAKEGRFNEALAELTTVLQTNSDSVHAHLAAGNIYLKQKHYQDALHHFLAVMQIDPLMAEASTKCRTCLFKTR
jgi:lipopolysaccharide biosynthesis regulator YciM